MTLEYKDVAGRPIKEGCFIVYAAQWGNSPVLKFGMVSTLKHSKYQPNIPTIGVITAESWRKTFTIQNKGREVTITNFEKVLVISEESLPDNLKIEFLAHDKGNMFK
jgi:hypothetical protein